METRGGGGALASKAYGETGGNGRNVNGGEQGVVEAVGGICHKSPPVALKVLSRSTVRLPYRAK